MPAFLQVCQAIALKICVRTILYIKLLLLHVNNFKDVPTFGSMAGDEQGFCA